MVSPVVPPDSPVLVLTGPTAVGKTALSLPLAQRLGAEIVSADSRQVYRPLTIGTAKPGLAERALVPHHFVDELDLDEPFSAGIFARAAWQRIGELRAQGRDALVVGGSTLYLEALVHGLAEVPPTSEDTRRRLTERLEAEGPRVLYDELRAIDPAAAATLDPTKTQRLVRALEVFHDTGRPLSHYLRQRVRPPWRFRVVVLTRPRADLYARINARVDEMLAAGLVDENRALLAAGYSQALNPLRTIGYQEPMAYLAGEIPYDEMVRQLKRNTRRYAKRQLTWFRRRAEYIWIDLAAEPDMTRLVERVAALGI